jgi:hypothetical protein
VRLGAVLDHGNLPLPGHGRMVYVRRKSRVVHNDDGSGLRAEELLHAGGSML